MSWVRRASTSSADPAPSMIVVSSLVTVTLRAWPSMSIVTFSSLMPRSGATSAPPVRMAMSSSMALRRSPKPGALTATELNVPRTLLTTRVASASPSRSSAMMRNGLPACMTFSRTGRMSRIEMIFWLTIRM